MTTPDVRGSADVLVIEGYQPIRDLIEDLCRQQGLSAHVCSTFADAQTLLETGIRYRRIVTCSLPPDGHISQFYGFLRDAVRDDGYIVLFTGFSVGYIEDAMSPAMRGDRATHALRIVEKGSSTLSDIQALLPASTESRA